MDNRPKHELVIDTRGRPPVVELTGEGSAVYVRLNPGIKYVRTVTVHEWPVINIDVGADDLVIGIEAIGIQEFTIQHVMAQAGLEAPAEWLAGTRYVHAPREAQTA